MITLLWILYILVCIFLIGIVLLQPGEGGNVASALGAASSQTAFGARGSMSMLQKVTAILAITFMVISIALSFLMSGKQSSILEKAPKPPVQEKPVKSPPPPPSPEK